MDGNRKILDGGADDRVYVDVDLERGHAAANENEKQAGIGVGDDDNDEHGRRQGGPKDGRRLDDKDVPHSVHSQSSVLTPEDLVEAQVRGEAGNAIKYRTCSWQKTAALLFSEYICLAIMSFPASYATLGLFPGLLLTIVVAGLVLYTSLTLWRFCLRHPDIRDVCDIGQYLFWGSRWAWYLTATMFLLNNTFIMGLHCLVGAEWLNTVSDHGTCTIAFAVVTAVVSWVCSLPRTFGTLSKLGTASAAFTFVSVILAAIFAGIQSHPAGWSPARGAPIIAALPAKGTTFVAGLNAFLNISYTFVGQITLPSFIAEMKQPRDFPKALWAVTVAEVVVFAVVGAVVYAYTGRQYMASPAFGALGNRVEKIVSFSFMVPTLVFLGVLYASVSARFLFFRLFAGTRHVSSHTVVGWAAWAALLAGLWVLAWIVAEVIPFFSDLLSIMSSLFDSFFGFIFWGVAYLRLRRAQDGPGFWHRRGWPGYVGLVVNVAIIGIGLFFLGPGTYASVESVVLSYRAGTVGRPFTCANNGI